MVQYYTAHMSFAHAATFSGCAHAHRRTAHTRQCSVVTRAPTRTFPLCFLLQELGKAVVVAGCVPQGDRKLRDLEGVSVLGVTQVDRVVEAVEETLKVGSVMNDPIA